MNATACKLTKLVCIVPINDCYVCVCVCVCVCVSVCVCVWGEEQLNK